VRGPRSLVLPEGIAYRVPVNGTVMPPPGGGAKDGQIGQIVLGAALLLECPEECLEGRLVHCVGPFD